MSSRTELHGKLVQWCGRGVFIVLPLSFVRCESKVIVADEQSAQSRIEQDGGDADGSDAVHVTLCGSARCSDLSVAVSGAGPFKGYACCADPHRSACGISLLTECVELNQPGHLDSTCPGFPTTAIGPLPGCCRPDDTCGVLDTKFGSGCADPGQIIGGLLGITPPITSCTY